MTPDLWLLGEVVLAEWRRREKLAAIHGPLATGAVRHREHREAALSYRFEPSRVRERTATAAMPARTTR
jgi:hypothetical protein